MGRAGSGKDGKLSAMGVGLATGLWDTTTGEYLAPLKGHRVDVYGLAFSPDGRTLATGSTDALVKLWIVASREELTTFVGADGVHVLAFAPDGTLAAGYSNGKVPLWRTGGPGDPDHPASGPR